MARVPALDSSRLPPPLAAIYETYGGAYGPFRNQVAVMAHVPPAVEHLCSLLIELKQRQAIRWRYVELAIVVVSKLNACDYCVGHHAPMLQVEGLPQDAIDSLPAGDHPALDDVDRLVIEYATQVTQQPGRIRDGLFERLRAQFSHAQIVELTLRIALCGFFNRFNDALQIDSEPELHPLHPATHEETAP